MNETLKKMSKDGTLTKLSKQFFNKADVSKKLDIDVQDVDL